MSVAAAALATMTMMRRGSSAAMKEVRSSAPMLTGMVPYDPKYLKSETLLSANESPYSLPEQVVESIQQRIASFAFNRYPDPLANELRKLIAEWQGVKVANVLCGNGGDELLYDVFVAWGGPGRKMLNFSPTFSVYETNAELTGTQVVNMPRCGNDWHIDIDKACERLAEGDIDIVVLTSPNNPTGAVTPIEDIRRVLDASDALVLVDEAYGEFADESALKLLEEYENLLILHTFSKAYRCAGVRLGYFLGSSKVITEFKKVRQPYSVDAISQIVGEEVVKARSLFDESIEEIKKSRDELIEQLSALDGVEVYPSDANFVMFKTPFAMRVWKNLNEQYSVLVRDVSGDPRLPDRLRVSIGTPEENARFMEALKEVLSEVGSSR